MLGINRKLEQLESDGTIIRVGLVGAGQMGRGMVSQIESMKGMRVVVTADIVLENVKLAYERAGVPKDEVIETDEISKAADAIQAGKVVATGDAELVTALSEVDVVVDATGIPNIGAKIAWDAILNKKHIVMLNVEADVTVGPLLKQMADACGVVYTGSAGDEPGAVMELYDFADALGFEVVALGKGKNNPLNVEANPQTAAEEAKRKGASPKMLASFQDGTKTMVEMTAVANATGFLPDKPGMNGFVGTVEELPAIFRRKEEGGQVENERIVEYINGVAPGVFAIVKSDKEEVNHEMTYLSMGEGPNYVLYRPYHLTSLETPISIARAHLYHEATIAPWQGLQAETVAVAKKDLAAGEFLDSIGGFTVYGTILTVTDAKEKGALPIGLVDAHVQVKRPIKKGEIITYDDVEQKKESTIWRLRRIQDETLVGKRELEAKV
ncbi:NAD(P)H-dependent oxidoreductase [Halalkalibacterium halodurans]|uniref:BH0774 protein n=1 Tax=Halalkalibacterium halodurans (strain ATCC BAA-125 / DSM 18197 / FERM 7344 / JCM 9153 / C-125) TaxID=272558 RepID=Q9KES5_HALH5|nr:NAD(P)H-dependent oxidoreductase [Halalkalibacterium halodurans]MED4171455.1 NAD(P)H-dependent oxidoreductase [Halalkalibacterium halodurans]BAB04493.1 BH0774 [Halalkalibacterium halodurans C-125]